jgi:hypothetical protein
VERPGRYCLNIIDNLYNIVNYLPIFKGDTELRDFYLFTYDGSKGFSDITSNYLNTIQVIVDVQNGYSGATSQESITFASCTDFICRNNYLYDIPTNVESGVSFTESLKPHEKNFWSIIH